MSLKPRHLIIGGIVYWLSPVSILPANILDEIALIVFVYKQIKKYKK